MMYKGDKLWNILCLMMAAAIHVSVAAWAASGWGAGETPSPVGKDRPLAMEINLAMIAPSTVPEPVVEDVPPVPEPAPMAKPVKPVSLPCYTEPEESSESEPVSEKEPPVSKPDIAAKTRTPDPDLPLPQSDPVQTADITAPEEFLPVSPSLPPGMSSPLRPRYPRTSRLKREEGDVTVGFRVRKNGRAEDIQIVKSSGYARLDRAAAKAVRRHEFIPARNGDEVTGSPCTLTIRFEIKS